MIDQLIIGVVSGVVASVCFSLFLIMVRPKLMISDKLCQSNDETNVYRIKIVNKSMAILNNIHYSLHYCRDLGDGIKEIEEIAPRKTKVSFIDKYSWLDKDGDYAVRISYVIDTAKYPMDDGAYLEFNIMASHSLSNTMRCVKKVYAKKDIQLGFFETGKSMKILVGKSVVPTKDAVVTI